MEIDNADIGELRELNSLLEILTDEIIQLHIKWSQKRVLIFQLLSNAEIKETLSWENKLIKLRSLFLKEVEVLTAIDDYLWAEGELTQKKYKREQIEEKIKSLKKIMDISPK